LGAIIEQIIKITYQLEHQSRIIFNDPVWGVFQQNPCCLRQFCDFLFSSLQYSKLSRLKTKNPRHFVLRDFVEVGGGLFSMIRFGGCLSTKSLLPPAVL
jgi:hypothetical protein